MSRRYELAVVGAGIAGSEAAWAAAREGLDVLLVTTSLDTVYLLAHDRHVLQPPEGTLMHRLLGGSGETAQVRRAQLYLSAKYALESMPNVHLLQSNVTGLVVSNGAVTGLETWEGIRRFADRTVIAAGTFLEPRLRQGELVEAAGRLGEMAYDELSADLRSHGIRLEQESIEMSGGAGELPYTVTFSRFAAGELAADGASTRLAGFYACGSCAQGPLSYEEAAAAGSRLGRLLAQPSAR